VCHKGAGYREQGTESRLCVATVTTATCSLFPITLAASGIFIVLMV
jgi:hypothetical protein